MIWYCPFLGCLRKHELQYSENPRQISANLEDINLDQANDVFEDRMHACSKLT